MYNDYWIKRPDDIPETWKAAQIVRCPHGPIVRWTPPACNERGECPECDGCGYLEAHGKTITVEVDCPECDGDGFIDDGAPPDSFPASAALWSTAYGERIEPELNIEGEISYQWLMQWIYSRDRVAA